jgi:hypothetical protein
MGLQGAKVEKKAIFDAAGGDLQCERDLGLIWQLKKSKSPSFENA